MENAKTLCTSINPSPKLDKDENGKLMDEKQYRGMIGSFLYLTTNRPNIMFSVCLYAIY